MARTRVSFEEVKTVMASEELGVSTDISLTDIRVIGRGTFGIVYRARLLHSKETVAMKKVIQNKLFRNREVEITRELNHCNIVKLMYFYYHNHDDEKGNICMHHLIMEFFPTNLSQVMKRYFRVDATLPLSCTVVYMYQLFRALAYLHSIGICHRDIKPNNMLLNEETGVLKLCDFGSAKHLERGKASTFYICGRHYRAPELLFQANDYTTMIDVWSAGCVLAETVLGHKLFPGVSSEHQLDEIVCVLGNPTPQEIRDMNKNVQLAGPIMEGISWHEVFRRARFTADGIDLVSRLLVYTPSARLTPLQACAHAFFDVLRRPNVTWYNKKLPSLFNFTEHELKIQPDLNSILIPAYLRDSFDSAVNESNTCDMEIEPSASSSMDWSTAAELQLSTSNWSM